MKTITDNHQTSLNISQSSFPLTFYETSSLYTIYDIRLFWQNKFKKCALSKKTVLSRS